MILTILAAAGLPQLTVDVGYRTFLGTEHPSVLQFDAFLERFGGGLPIAAVWSCRGADPCASVFDVASLEMASAVASQLASKQGVRRVRSPATSPLLVPTSEGFDLRRLVERGTPAQDRARLAARALIDPSWVGSLISPDASIGAIVVELGSSDSDISTGVFRALESALEPFEARGFDFRLVGGPVEFVVAGGELQTATQRLIPAVVILVGLVLWVLFRSAPAVLATLGAMGVAVVWTMGLLGWLGWPQNSITQTLPPLVLVIGVCDGIHLISRFAAELVETENASNASRREALERASADIGPACAITSVTTAAGLLSFVSSDLESFVRFGIVAAFGVMAALALTFSLLPILLMRLPARGIRAAGDSRRWERGTALLIRAAERAPGAILLGTLLIGLASAIGMQRLRVDAGFEDLYGEDSRVVQWVRFVEENLRKPDTLEVELGLPETQRLESPAAIDHVEQIAAGLSSVEGLGRSHSVLEAIAWMNRIVHDDDVAFQRPGETARANAQLMLMLSLNDPRELDPWLSLDHRRVRISVESGKEPQERLRKIMRDVELLLADQLPEGWTSVVSGPLAVVQAMIEAIQQTQLRSFAVAAAVVAALVAVFLRSPVWALIAMVPTGLPVLVTLGAMGFLGVNLDVGTAMVAAIVVGIAVDDTVHLLSQYRRRRLAGLEPAEAVRHAIPHVGRALVTTSIALTLGFFTLMVSPWQSVASFGLVAGIAILVALLAALVLLPALIVSLARLSLPSRPKPR